VKVEIKKHEKQDAQEEKMAVGEIGLKTYWEYFKIAESTIGLAILVLVLVLAQLSISSMEYWLSYWYGIIFKIFRTGFC